MTVLWLAIQAAAWDGEHPATAAEAIFLGSTRFDVFGNRADLGDGDGDGRPDVAVGAPRQDDGGETSGATYLFFQPRPGVYSADEAADLKLTGEAADDFSGYAVAFADDVDGDGADDLLVGARDHDAGGTDAGAAYLILLPQTGTVGLADSAAKFVGVAAGDNAGRDVYRTGDFDGDALPDVLVTAPFHDPDGRDEAGTIYLLPGTSRGTVPLDGAPVQWVGEAAKDFAGLRAVSFGDANGDGRSDLAIGAQGSDRSGDDAGAVYVLTTAGTGTASLADADAIVTGVDPGDEAGASVATMGDLNGDGLADLGIATGDANTGETGAAFLALAPFAADISLADTFASVAGTWVGGRAGNHMSSCDFDGDATLDLVVAAHEAGPGEQEGRVYVFWGPAVPAARTTDAADVIFAGSELDNFGQDLACADVDGDGADDLLVGSEGHDNAIGGYLAGGAFLFYGEPGDAREPSGAEGCGCETDTTSPPFGWGFSALLLLAAQFRRR